MMICVILEKSEVQRVKYVAEGHTVVGMELHSIAGGLSVLGRNGWEHVCQAQGGSSHILAIVNFHQSSTLRQVQYHCVPTL